VTLTRQGARPSRVRSGRSPGLRRALAALGGAALALARLELALLVSGPVEPAWRSRSIPGSRSPTSPVACLRGIGLGAAALLAAGLLNTDIAALAAIGLVFAKAPIGIVLHVLLAFPSGRLRDPTSRALVAAGYMTTIALQAPQYLFSSELNPFNPFEIDGRPDLVKAGRWVQDTAGALVIVLTALVLARRLHAADRSRRVVLGSLWVYGIAAILFLEVSANALPRLFGTAPLTVFVLQMSVLAWVPLAFATGLLRGGFARVGALEELGEWLGEGDGARPALRDALAATLGDPSLELVFRLGDGTWSTADGRIAELPRAGSGRAAAQVELAGEDIGAIVYDAQLIADPGPVRAAGRVIALALERERLTAALLAGREALRESRARIVEAGDRERRRIAQDLHDGLQGRLALLGLRAGRLAVNPATAAAEASAIRSELTRPPTRSGAWSPA
jgi:signal transduction histidine kinase